ncbi:hypothetical protein NDU88_004193 [Pleurodeles waltl]|uniref:Retrotransposon gag domain-containing protein n=1 Tax=Pleurodeles waltl TaxID=8319 RepID=A0AAV7V147_PLEWA|nr:hypothetical protein NDU88_004193 [Pleurodeles waltl]
MAGYEDQADDGYYLDEPTGSFEQDLVYTLDAGVRHTVNQALAQVIKPIKHQLLGFAEHQGWVAPSGIQPIMEPPLPVNTQASKQSTNPHSADFESIIRNMAREHDYNSGSQKKAVCDPVSSSSEHSSEQEDDLPSKRKKKANHQEAPTRRVLAFEPEDIVHLRSSLWLPPPEVADYMESHIRHSFDKEEEFLRIFDRRTAAQATDNELLEIRQGNKDLVAYLAHLNKLIVETAWPESKRAAIFYRGLRDELKDALAQVPNRPTEISELIDLVLQIDHRLTERRAEKRREYRPFPLRIDRVRNDHTRAGEGITIEEPMQIGSI